MTRKALQQPLFAIRDPKDGNNLTCLNPECPSSYNPDGIKEKLKKGVLPEGILCCEKCGTYYQIRMVEPANAKICDKHLTIKSIIPLKL